MASFSSSLNCLVYGFKSIPCFSFGSRNGDSIAKKRAERDRDRGDIGDDGDNGDGGDVETAKD